MDTSKDFCFSSKRYADVGLPTRKEGNFSFGLSSFGAGKRFSDNSPKAFMFVGNLKGIFGEVLNGELRPDLSNEQTFGKNFSEWLVKEVSLGSVFYVVGTNSLINEYFKPVFNKVGEWLCKRCKFRAYSIERFAKLKKLPLKSEKDYGLIYIEIIKWLMNEERVEFDYILMNPPYNVGNSITKFAILPTKPNSSVPTNFVKERIIDENGDVINEELPAGSHQTLLSDGKCVCLMPLSQYKSNNLYRHVEDFRLADPDMFEDADITNNLCICTLRKDVVDKYKTYEEMSMESYDPAFKAFYEVNKPNGTFYDAGQPWANNKKLFDWNDTWVYLCRAAADGVHSEDATDRRWNLAESRVEIDDIQRPGKDGNGRYSLRVIKFVKGDTRKSCKNLSTWFYAYGKDGLADKLLHSLKKNSGSIELAIPQIDWEAISDTPLWKEGKYDEAVLDVMGLKWNDKKDGVEEIE